jgi:hypothetical protein
MPDLAQHLFGLTVDFFKQHLLCAHIGNVLVCVRLASLALSSVGKHRPPPLDFVCGFAALCLCAFALNTYDGNIIATRLRRGLSCPGV